MAVTYLHIFNQKEFGQNLKNLIDNRPGHFIVYTDQNTCYSLDTGEIIPDSDLLELARESSAVFVHFLDVHKARLVNALPDRLKIVWFFWGGDGYYLGKFDNEFLLPDSRRLRLKLNLKYFWKGGWRDLLKMVLGSWVDFIYPNRQVLKAIRKVNLIIPVVPQDYHNLAERYAVDSQMFHVNYINSIFFSRPEVPAGGENILLGNSARISNNHLEAIDVLSSFDLGQRKVIIPLSYGNKYYGHHIEQYALNRLGENASILNSLLPLGEYRELLESCNTVVMNHCRQQGLGNIVMALWYKMTIFLNPQSGLFQYLREHQFRILEVSEFDPAVKLTEEEKDWNREKLFEVFGPDCQRKKFGQMLQILNQR